MTEFDVTSPEYKNFRFRLWIDFVKTGKAKKIDNKGTLTVLMKRGNYRVKNNQQRVPSRKQVEFAWQYIKLHGKQLKVTEFRKKVSYGSGTVAGHSTTIGKKKYRKGQFMPKK